eukprot:TRINITY_DN59929_c0_g1_i1.p2 TRINITY_DN59929_c0_g1~~TRINITY_DN59929_c0_g1_i1.p2  ORF type:complete len:104 (-),score=25.30 TRINITY_DN59929_c0_g1_i1:91-402(-)
MANPFVVREKIIKEAIKIETIDSVEYFCAYGDNKGNVYSSQIQLEGGEFEIIDMGVEKLAKGKIDQIHILKLTKLIVMLSGGCLLYTSPSPRDLSTSRMPSSA